MKIVKSKLQTTTKEGLIKNMGYSSIKQGLKTLDDFLNYQNLADWIEGGKYDFKYTSKEFYLKLCEVLKIDKKTVQTSLEEAQLYIEEKMSCENSYIYVNTNFRRTSEPIFVLAFMEHSRRFKPTTEELLFKSDEEVMTIISEMVKKHYTEVSGKLKVWGDIKNYIYHHKDGKSYVFDIDGKIIKNKKITETLATIRI